MAYDSLKVMSYNLRFASATAPNEWSVRRTPMANLMNAELPDVIGTQEGIRAPIAQLQNIKTDLGASYGRVGAGRDDGLATGEHMAIFYKKTRLMLCQSGNFWLSGTPYVRGSNTYGNAFIRMTTWALFRDRVTGKSFYHYNTHLDNTSSTGRASSGVQIRNRIIAHNPVAPMVITGDFNQPAEVGNAIYDAFTTDQTVPLRDAWTWGPIRGTVNGTYHNYGGLVVNGERIDWILVSPEIVVESSTISTANTAGQYPSDHLPVISTIRLP